MSTIADTMQDLRIAAVEAEVDHLREIVVELTTRLAEITRLLEQAIAERDKDPKPR